MIKIIIGDIFTSNAKYIAHQCNCVSKGASGIAYSIFNNLPHADIYSTRKNVDIKNLGEEAPGNIVIRGNGVDQRLIINIMGQVFPGPPKYPNSDLDGYVARQRYFREALEKTMQINDLQSVAMPQMIGCGLAGGDFDSYQKIIQEFDIEINKLQEVEVQLFQFQP